MPTPPEPEPAPTCSCPWQNSWRTSQEGSVPHPPRGAEPLQELDILLGWISSSFGLGANWSPQSAPHQINLETTVCPCEKKKEVVHPWRGTPSSGGCSPGPCPPALLPSASAFHDCSETQSFLLNQSGRKTNFKQLGPKLHKQRSLFGGACQVTHLRGAHVAVCILYPLNIEGSGVIFAAVVGS